MDDQKLAEVGLKFKKTRLGQAAFIPIDTTGPFAIKILFPDDWSVAELRTMADYMEHNPICTIFEDGSGQPCKINP